MKKYSEDFGEALKQIANDDDADPVDLLYYLKQLESLGISMNNGDLNEDDVNLVFEHEGISKEVLLKIIDKFLYHISLNMQK